MHYTRPSWLVEGGILARLKGPHYEGPIQTVHDALSWASRTIFSATSATHGGPREFYAVDAARCLQFKIRPCRCIFLFPGSRWFGPPRLHNIILSLPREIWKFRRARLDVRNFPDNTHCNTLGARNFQIIRCDDRREDSLNLCDEPRANVRGRRKIRASVFSRSLDSPVSAATSL